MVCGGGDEEFIVRDEGQLEDLSLPHQTSMQGFLGKKMWPVPWKSDKMLQPKHMYIIETTVNNDLFFRANALDLSFPRFFGGSGGLRGMLPAKAHISQKGFRLERDIYELLSDSRYRVKDPSEANLFYIPTFVACWRVQWGNSNLI